MAELGAKSELPSRLPLPHQPKIGEKASPLASDPNEIAQVLRGIAANATDAVVTEGSSTVMLSAASSESQGALPGVTGLVSTRMDVIFANDGFLNSVTLTRGEGSALPSTERTFEYNPDGVVTKIEDVFIYPSGKRTVAARQTYEDGEVKSVFYPDDGRDVAAIIESTFAFPHTNEAIDMTTQVAELLREGVMGDTEAPISILEQSENHVLAVSHHAIFVPTGEFLEAKGIRLEKDASGRWHPVENTFSYLPVTTDAVTPLGTGAVSATYSEDGLLREARSFAEGNPHTVEVYTYREFPLFDADHNPTGQTIRMFDIATDAYDPNHPELPAQELHLDFIPYVFLRTTNIGKGSNFDVSVEDTNIEVGGVAYLQRRVTLSDGRILQAQLAFDSDGRIDQQQEVQLMLVEPNERRGN